MVGEWPTLTGYSYFNFHVSILLISLSGHDALALVIAAFVVIVIDMDE